MSAIAIYTVLTGDKEPIGDPVARLSSPCTDLDINFICFTDNPNLCSNTWEIRHLDTHSLPPEKSSRRPKAMPHVYLPDYKYSLYLDNICELKRYPTSQDLKPRLNSSYLYRLFKHSSRQSLVEEALAVASLGYEKGGTLIDQLHAYEKQIPLSSINPLSTCTVLLREHNHNAIKSHGILWWEHILNFSKRDQLSFDYCRLITKTQVDYFSGTKFDNDLIWHHSNVNNKRILASFDKEKFDWLQKKRGKSNDAKKDNDPDHSEIRALSNHDSAELELLAYLTRSPLGKFYMPRLGLADTLQSIFTPYRGKIKSVLGLYAKESCLLSLEEFTASVNAIALYLQAEQINSEPHKSPSPLKLAQLHLNNMVILSGRRIDNRLTHEDIYDDLDSTESLYQSTDLTVMIRKGTLQNFI